MKTYLKKLSKLSISFWGAISYTAMVILPNFIVITFLSSFARGIIVKNSKDNLNIVIVTLLAIATILFTWAACAEDDNQKKQLLNIAKRLFHGAILFVFVACIYVLEQQRNQITESYGAASKLILVIIRISRIFLCAFAIAMSALGLTATNIFIYFWSGKFDIRS